MQELELSRISQKLFVNFASYQLSKLPSLDGLKAVQRRILYVLKNYNSWTKSARVVGEVIAKYHPHGDGSVYDALVHLACRGLARMRGNTGSCGRLIDDIRPAAYRYTETARQNAFNEINEMYDLLPYTFYAKNELNEIEPVLLPAKYPLTMTFLGYTVKPDLTIAVGTSTSLPTLTKQSMNDFIRFFIDRAGDKISMLNSYEDVYNLIMKLRPKATKLSEYPRLKARFSRYQTHDIELDPAFVSKTLEIEFITEQVRNGYKFFEVTSSLKQFAKNRDKFAKVFTDVSKIRLLDLSRDEPEVVITTSVEEDIPKIKELFSKDKYSMYISISLPKPQVIGNEEHSLLYITVQLPVGLLLIGNFLVYYLAHKRKRQAKIEQLQKQIRELEVIAYIREQLKRLKTWDVDPNVFAEKISNDKFSADEIKTVLSKHAIKRLLTIRTDTDKLTKELLQVKNELENLVNILYEHYTVEH